MNEHEEMAGEPAVAAVQAEGLDVQIAQELVERAKAAGVSLVGPGGLLAGVTKTVLQAALESEMAEHLGYEKGDPAGRGSGNSRNGTSPKTVLTEIGPVELGGATRPQRRTSNRRSSPSMPGGSRGSTRRSCRCTPKG